MPWCDDCAKFWNPSSMNPGGACPTCGRVIADLSEKVEDPQSPPRPPWHFTVLVVALVIYLGYRAVQGIEWLVIHL